MRFCDFQRRAPPTGADMPPPSHLAVGMPLPDASPTLPSFRKQHLLVELYVAA